VLIASNFHYIREDFTTPYPSIFGVTPNEFEAQLDALAKEGDFIALDDIIDCIKNDQPLDKHYICVTFDDGLKEQFELAMPILQRKGIPFIFFINPSNYIENSVSIVHQVHLLRSQIPSSEILNTISGDTSGNTSNTHLSLTAEEKLKARQHYNFDSPADAELKYILNFKLSFAQQKQLIASLFQHYFDEKEVSKQLYMDEEELKKVAACNCLGSHTYHHFPLGKLSREEIAFEIAESQKALTSLTGKPIEAISYPYGSFEACAFPVVEYAERNGFVFGFTMERAANNNNITHQPLAMARFDCNDVVGGKHNIFKAGQMFNVAPLRNWNIYA
jgi:peptidoglycan/xylan/chitin deacetylase (PgdA/CDA1 family)